MSDVTIDALILSLTFYNEFIYKNRNKKSLVKLREFFSQINNSVMNDPEIKIKSF